MSEPLERAVAIMDRLRSPGGCPWDAAQTHRSLARYLLEESYEVIEAIETDDLALLREELGDLLLQVLFHARLTQELPAGQSFGIDEVAGDLADKLVRRHPHVFAGAEAGDAAALNETWERNKIAEKGRTSAVDGVPLDQPALALAAKLVARAHRAGLSVTGTPTPADARDPADGDAVGPDGGNGPEAPGSGNDPADRIGRQLFALVVEAVDAGVDPEGALRGAARAYRSSLLAAEAATPPGGTAQRNGR